MCSSSGGAQEQGKRGSEFHPPLNDKVLFCRFWTKFRVLDPGALFSLL
jgi:hypothetical protein